MRNVKIYKRVKVVGKGEFNFILYGKFYFSFDFDGVFCI